MNILVDADACPVKEIIVRLARKQKVPVTMLVSTRFTEPFNQPIEYGRYIAQLGNMTDGRKSIFPIWTLTPRTD